MFKQPWFTYMLAKRTNNTCHQNLTKKTNVSLPRSTQLNGELNRHQDKKNSHTSEAVIRFVLANILISLVALLSFLKWFKRANSCPFQSQTGHMRRRCKYLITENKIKSTVKR